MTSLTLEDMISNRYDVLLQDHVQKAFKKARYSTMVFSLSDSVNLLCMALTFYYGGTLLASREYGAINFFVIYIAVINGAESAGSFLSFGPSKLTPRTFRRDLFPQTPLWQCLTRDLIYLLKILRKLHKQRIEFSASECHRSKRAR